MTGRSLNIILFSLITTSLFSQTGGDNSYEFLNLTHSALVSSLGGVNVSVFNDDVNMTYHNPALLNNNMDKSLALNFVNYFAGINYGFAMYSRSLNSSESIAGGITYLNYGSFTETDPSGNITGVFSASEYAFSIIYSRNIDSAFSIGVNFKPVLSHLDNYTSIGFAFDAGAVWHSSDNLLSAGFVIKNAGYQITSYAGEPRGRLPFEIEAGITQKLAHAPFRLSLTVRHLEKYDLTHDYHVVDPSGNSSVSEKTGIAGLTENLLRHAIIGIELIPAKTFYLSAGYNYQRRRELQTDSKVSAVGLSWGFGINLSYLSLGFGRATYHLAGSSNHFSVVLRPDLFYSRFHK
jgi:hypothetical protein